MKYYYYFILAHVLFIQRIRLARSAASNEAVKPIEDEASCHSMTKVEVELMPG